MLWERIFWRENILWATFNVVYCFANAFHGTEMPGMRHNDGFAYRWLGASCRVAHMLESILQSQRFYKKSSKSEGKRMRSGAKFNRFKLAMAWMAKLPHIHTIFIKITITITVKYYTHEYFITEIEWKVNGITLIDIVKIEIHGFAYGINILVMAPFFRPQTSCAP